MWIDCQRAQSRVKHAALLTEGILACAWLVFDRGSLVSKFELSASVVACVVAVPRVCQRRFLMRELMASISMIDQPAANVCQATDGRSAKEESNEYESAIIKHAVHSALCFGLSSSLLTVPEIVSGERLTSVPANSEM